MGEVRDSLTGLFRLGERLLHNCLTPDMKAYRRDYKRNVKGKKIKLKPKR